MLLDILARAVLLACCVPLAGVAGVLAWSLVDDIRRVRAGRWPRAVELRLREERRRR